MKNELPFHRYQQKRDIAIEAEDKRRRGEFEKNLAAKTERIMGLQSVLEHLSKPQPENVEPHLGNKVPMPKPREQLCKDFFHCNIWNLEPVLLDELAAARLADDSDRIDEIRNVIRAASWMTHKRTDANVAVEIAREKAGLILHEHEIHHAILTDEGFEKESRTVDSDLVGIKQVIDDLENFRSIGKDTEHSLRYVESSLEQDWQEFLKTIKEEHAPWPENPAVELTGKSGDLAERIEAWRMIRDQLYFQRYNENLSKIGQMHSEPKNPFID